MAMQGITVEDGGESFLEGKLLIALPGMPDPRFERSVIFICAHSGQGAMGLIINKAVEGLNFPPILFGGPMQTERGFVLHSGDFESGDSTLPVTRDVSLTATLDILRAIASGQGPQRSLFALGYAGWSGGQIEDEIRANGWIHCDADMGLVFDTSLDAKWGEALRKLGIDASSLSANTGSA